MVSFLWWNLVIPLTLTVAVEGLLAWLVLKTKHDVVTVILAQCITNPVLNFCLVLNASFGYFSGVWLAVCLEIVVMVAEAEIYLRCFSIKNRGKAWGFSVGANVVAVAMGLFLFWIM